MARPDIGAGHVQLPKHERSVKHQAEPDTAEEHNVDNPVDNPSTTRVIRQLTCDGFPPADVRQVA
jgi:hypothetical protein